MAKTKKTKSRKKKTTKSVENSTEDYDEGPTEVIKKKKSTTAKKKKKGLKSILKKPAVKEKKALERKQNESDEINNNSTRRQFGTKNKVSFILVRIIHLLDLLAGVLCIAYGVTLDINGDYKTYATFFISFGTFLSTSSVFGSIGFMSSMCDRVFLSISAVMGIFIGLTEFVIGVTILISMDAFFDFLAKNNEDFDLTDDNVVFLQDYAILFIILIFLFGVMEFYRSYSLRMLRKNLVSIEEIVKKSNTRNDSLAEPLLPGAYEDDDDNDSDFAPVDSQLYTDGNWWADKNQFQNVSNDDNPVKNQFQNVSNDDIPVKEKAWMKGPATDQVAENVVTAKKDENTFKSDEIV